MPYSDPVIITVIVAGLFFAGFVKGVVGLGFPLVALAFLLNVIGPTEALGLIVVPLFAANLVLIYQVGKPLPVFKRFWPLIAVLVITIFISSRLTVILDAELLLGILGACVVIFTSTSFFHPGANLSQRGEKWGGVLSGLIGGLTAGFSTVFGPPITMYFIMLKLEKDYFIRAVGVVWFSASVPILLSYIELGIVNKTNLIPAVLSCIPTGIGMWIGGLLRQKINQDLFRKTILVTLFLIGLNLIRRAFF